ncbi:MAG: hypothetical protein WCF85_03970 [Rhodospirillaceae bacterium]
MLDTRNKSAIRSITESRAAALASIETGAHMLTAALKQLAAIDSRLIRHVPDLRVKLKADEDEVGVFVAELIDQYLPLTRYKPPRDGVRPLPARVASARTIESWAAE